MPGDVEVIALAWDLLAALGVQELELEINSLGTLEDRQRYRAQLVAWLKERADQLDPDSRASAHQPYAHPRQQEHHHQGPASGCPHPAGGPQ